MMLICPTIVVYVMLAEELYVLAAVKLYRPDGCLIILGWSNWYCSAAL